MRIFTGRASDFEGVNLTAKQEPTSAICTKPATTAPSLHTASSIDLPTYPMHVSSSRTESFGSIRRDSSIYCPSLPSSSQAKSILSEYELKASLIGDGFPSKDHKTMVQAMFLDNIYYATARLHRHNWILKSGNERYKELKTAERWDTIHEDLERYTKAIENYERWLNCKVQYADVEATTQPPSIRLWGRTLAILECAQHYAAKSGENLAPAVLEELSRPLFKSRNPLLGKLNTAWTRPKTFARPDKERRLSQFRLFGIVPRSIIAVLGGSALIVPVLVVALDPRMLTAVFTVSACFMAVGMVTAAWMSDAQKQDVFAAMLLYGAVWTVFLTCERGLRS